MKIGEGLGSKGTLASVLKVQDCSKVSGYPSWKEIKILMLKDAMILQKVTPLYELYRYMWPRREGFFNLLVINWTSILAILIFNGVWF